MPENQQQSQGGKSSEQEKKGTTKKAAPKRTNPSLSPIPPELTQAQTHHEAMQALAGEAFSKTTVDRAIDKLTPTMSEYERHSTERLYEVFGRACNAVGYKPPVVGTLVELGIGTAPYLPAVEAAFAPIHYVGVDTNAITLRKARENYPSFPTEGQGSLSLVEADIIDPDVIPGLQPDGVDVVVTFHPDIADIEAEAAANDDSFIANPNALTALDNWRRRLSPEGIMIATTYDPEEAEAIVSDKRLSPFVHLYGVTGILSEGETHGYVVVLRSNPRAEGAAPIVWTNEQYSEYDTDTYTLQQNRDMRDMFE